jgi:hypothetical protein
MIDNTLQVASLGGAGSLPGHRGPASGDAAVAGDSGMTQGAAWSSNGRGNYWSDYRGYDEEGDGVGDQPYQPRPAFAPRLAQADTLRLFQFTLAQQAIDQAADMFPLYRYEAVIEDPAPLMSPPSGTGIRESERFNRELVTVSGALVALAAVSLLWASGFDAARIWQGAASRTRFARGGVRQ